MNYVIGDIRGVVNKVIDGVNGRIIVKIGQVDSSGNSTTVVVSSREGERSKFIEGKTVELFGVRIMSFAFMDKRSGTDKIISGIRAFL